MDATVVKSPNDKNLYKCFTLENGLRIVIISDQTTSDDCVNIHAPDSTSIETESDESDSEQSENEEMDEDCNDDNSDAGGDRDKIHMQKDLGENSKLAAAALSVRVGGFCDPVDVQGLAHFVEHLVFMGSTQYPKQNGLDSFLSRHGGSSNANTETETTNFYMDVIPSHFKKALDMFGQCLISPLLKRESMDVEIEAVDSEFSEVRPSDGDRINLVLQTAVKEGHPLGKFIWGNTESLYEITAQKGIDVREAVEKFFHRYYSSHYMTLAIQSPEPLERLEEWTREMFSQVPRRSTFEAPCFEDAQDPFDMAKFHQLYKVIPVRDINELNVFWSLPPIEKHYRVKPVEYIANLLGHEGKGSILSFLKKKSWALNLFAGYEDNGLEINSFSCLFKIQIDLTEKGMDHIFEVLTSIFQYLKMIQEAGPCEWIYNELKSVSDQSFQFQQQFDPIDNVTLIALNMQYFPCEDYLTGHKLYFKYDPQLISAYANALVVETANIMLVSMRYAKEHTIIQEEPWTKCKYMRRDIPEEWLTKWNDLEINPSFHLPLPNKFLATDYEIKHVASKSKYPYKIFENSKACLYFKEDANFKTPRAIAAFHFRAPMFVTKAEDRVMLDLFVKMLNLQLSEVAYPAEIANLFYDVVCTAEGFSVTIRGFNHKFSTLLEVILDNIANFKVGFEDFVEIKNATKLSYSNELLIPEKVCKMLEACVMVSSYCPDWERVTAIETVTLQKLMNFVEILLKNLFVESLIQGNIFKDEAIKMITSIIEKLSIRDKNVALFPEQCCYTVPCGRKYCCAVSYNQEDKNTVVTNIYQVGIENTELRCQVELLLEFMLEPCFDRLRTNEQLGYSVDCFKRQWCNDLAFAISIQSQSKKFSSKFIDDRIENFLEEFIKDLILMSDKKYQVQLSSYIETLKQVDLSLKVEFERNWYQIMQHFYNFDQKEKKLQYLEHMKKEVFIDWLEKELNQNKLRKMGFQVIGHDDELLNIENLEHLSRETVNHKCPFLIRIMSENMDDHITDLALFRKHSTLVNS